MGTAAYEDILSAAQRLDSEEQLRLAEHLIANARQHLAPSKRHSIRELRGLGKEIWEGVDVQAYIDRERDSWGG